MIVQIEVLTLSKLFNLCGKFYGELIETEIKDVGILRAVYMKDPEGNIVEIQSWK